MRSVRKYWVGFRLTEISSPSADVSFNPTTFLLLTFSNKIDASALIFELMLKADLWPVCRFVCRLCSALCKILAHDMWRSGIEMWCRHFDWSHFRSPFACLPNPKTGAVEKRVRPILTLKIRWRILKSRVGWLRSTTSCHQLSPNRGSAENTVRYVGGLCPTICGLSFWLPRLL